MPGGSYLTATASNPLSTSEFSECFHAGGSSPHGDIDCDVDVDSVDSLKVLRHVAGLTVSQTEPCPDLGIPADGGVFGDVDCGGDIDSVDALRLLRHVAGLPPLSTPPGCPPIG